MKRKSLMCRFLICLAESLETEWDIRLKAEFVGLLNLLLSCMYGHRNGVHARMTDQHVETAKQQGNAKDGYVIEVSIITVGLIRNAFFIHWIP